MQPIRLYGMVPRRRQIYLYCLILYGSKYSQVHGPSSTISQILVNKLTNWLTKPGNKASY